jgi:YbbR domain-containing protein
MPDNKKKSAYQGVWKMKKETFFDKILNNRKYLMLMSLVIAFLFWFLVVATISPDSTRTIYGVPITVNEDDGFLSTAGLHVIEESSAKISVDVSGPRYIIGRLSASDFTVTPDVSKVTKSGKYTLSLGASMKQPNPKVTIVKVHPATVGDKIRQGRIEKCERRRQAQQLQGGRRLYSRIRHRQPEAGRHHRPRRRGQSGGSKAVANVETGSNAKTTVTAKTTVKLYDSKGTLLDLKNIRENGLTVTVTVPILKLKSVPLTVDFSNIPQGFDKNNIKYTVTPSEISIAGEDKEVNAVTAIKLDSIDFGTLDISNNISAAVNVPATVTNVDNITTASVAVTLQNTSVKTLSTNNIKIVNIPSGYAARVRTVTLGNIRLFGPTSDIANVNDVTATVDMSAINVIEGTYSAPVTITVPGKTGYWVTGKYYVTINSWKN